MALRLPEGGPGGVIRRAARDPATSADRVTSTERAGPREHNVIGAPAKMPVFEQLFAPRSII